RAIVKDTVGNEAFHQSAKLLVAIEVVRRRTGKLIQEYKLVLGDSSLKQRRVVVRGWRRARIQPLSTRLWLWGLAHDRCRLLYRRRRLRVGPVLRANRFL